MFSPLYIFYSLFFYGKKHTLIPVPKPNCSSDHPGAGVHLTIKNKLSNKQTVKEDSTLICQPEALRLPADMLTACCSLMVAGLCEVVSQRLSGSRGVCQSAQAELLSVFFVPFFLSKVAKRTNKCLKEAEAPIRFCILHPSSTFSPPSRCVAGNGPGQGQPPPTPPITTHTRLHPSVFAMNVDFKKSKHETHVG